MTALARPKAVFDGWYVVAAVFVLLMVNSGLGFYGLSVFLEAITEEQGLSTQSVSFATSLFFIVSAVSGRLIAPIIQKRDIRLVVATGGLVAAVGLWLIGHSTQLVTLYLSYIVFATGVGLSGLVPGTTLVTRWFHVRRSVALSIASTGLSLGGITVTAVASQLIDRQGMRSASPWLSLIYLCFVALALPGLWPSPAARGSLPDGKVLDASAPAPVLQGQSYEQATSSLLFKLITLAFILAMGSQVGGIAHLFKLGEEIDKGTGATLVGALAFTSVIFRLIGGVVASRVSLLPLTSVLSAVQAVALLWLSQGNSRAMLLAATILFGATIGNLLMLQPLVVADRFGVANYPKIFALCQLIVTGIGVAGGPYLLGFLHDASGYPASYITAAVLSIAGSLVFLLAWRADPSVTRRSDSPMPTSGGRLAR